MSVKVRGNLKSQKYLTWQSRSQDLRQGSDGAKDEQDKDEGGNVDEDLVRVESHLLKVVAFWHGFIAFFKKEPLGNHIVTEEGELSDLDDEVADNVEVRGNLHRKERNVGDDVECAEHAPHLLQRRTESSVYSKVGKDHIVHRLNGLVKYRQDSCQSGICNNK